MSKDYTGKEVDKKLSLTIWKDKSANGYEVMPGWKRVVVPDRKLFQDETPDPIDASGPTFAEWSDDSGRHGPVHRKTEKWTRTVIDPYKNNVRTAEDYQSGVKPIVRVTEK